MVVPSVSAVFRFKFCRFAVSPFWHYARFNRFPASCFAVLASTVSVVMFSVLQAALRHQEVCLKEALPAGTPVSLSQPDSVIRKGQMGSSLMGSLQNSYFILQRGFLGTPVNLLLYYQKCQGVPFSQSVKAHYFCSGPISVDPICAQPNHQPADPRTLSYIMLYYIRLYYCYHSIILYPRSSQEGHLTTAPRALPHRSLACP